MKIPSPADFAAWDAGMLDNRQLADIETFFAAMLAGAEALGSRYTLAAMAFRAEHNVAKGMIDLRRRPCKPHSTGELNWRIEGFRQYRRSQIVELRPYQDGETLNDRVSISPADRDAGSPKIGDMIARNPKNHDDQWLIAAHYVSDNFEPVGRQHQTEK